MSIFSCTDFTTTTIFCSITPHTFSTFLYFLIIFVFTSFFPLSRFSLFSISFSCIIIIFLSFCFPFWNKCWIFFSTANAIILLDVFGFFFRYLDAITMIPWTEKLTHKNACWESYHSSHESQAIMNREESDDLQIQYAWPSCFNKVSILDCLSGRRNCFAISSRCGK